MADVPQGTNTSNTHEGDTPTHRTHLSQMKLNHIKGLIEQLQARRAAIVEKVRRVKANNKVAEELKKNKQLDRIFKKLEKNLKEAEARLDIAADELNKSRGILLDVTDGAVLLERTEKTDGSITNGTAYRGDTETGPT